LLGLIDCANALDRNKSSLIITGVRLACSGPMCLDVKSEGAHCMALLGKLNESNENWLFKAACLRRLSLAVDESKGSGRRLGHGVEEPLDKDLVQTADTPACKGDTTK